MKKIEEKFQEIEIENVKTISIKKRKNKVSIENLGKTYKSGDSFNSFLSSLPDVFAVKDFMYVIDAVSEAFLKKRAIIFMLGAHVIKCGLSPVIIDLMKIKIINENGSKSKPLINIMRNLFLILGPIEIIVYLIRKDKLRLGDIITRTRVVKN